MIELADIISVIQNPIVFIRPIMDNPWLVYPVLWAIVALESYFVLFAWMPAETTMFLAGSLAAHPDIPIELWLLWLGYLPTVYLGWQAKYKRGRKHKIKNARMDDTVAFFNSHAGESQYAAPRFKNQNVAGTLIWVLGSTVIGFFLGSVPFFQQHFSILIVGIIIVPAGIYYLVNFVNSFFQHMRG